MLEIVLLILKIAGIILASVLGILIVGLFCILFVPVRYQGDFSVSDGENGEKKKVGAMFRATWLLWLVRVYVSYEEALRVRVKLLFFTLMDTAKEKKAGEKKKKRGKDKEKKGKRKKEEEKEEEKTEVEKAGVDTLESPEKSEDGAEGNRKSGKAENPSKEEPAGEEAGETVEAAENGKEKKKKKKSRKEKKSIKERISNILQTIRNFCDKLKGIKEKAEKIKELWISEHMVRGRSLLWRELVYLLKHTKPRKLEGYLRFGFDDPSTTGYAMAVYGILYPIWNPKLSVEPDFEKQILDCHIRIKGKIRVCHILKVVLRLLLSKDVRLVIKDFKKL